MSDHCQEAQLVTRATVLLDDLPLPGRDVEQGDGHGGESTTLGDTSIPGMWCLPTDVRIDRLTLKCSLVV
jgi:hypothetical protein